MADTPGYHESRRIQLQTELETILGSRQVYFQPPQSIYMSYPSIVYERCDIKNIHADNAFYAGSYGYTIIVLDKDPTSELVEKLSKRYPTIKFSRHYVVDGLNHDVFTLYY